MYERDSRLEAGLGEELFSVSPSSRASPTPLIPHSMSPQISFVVYTLSVLLLHHCLSSSQRAIIPCFPNVGKRGTESETWTGNKTPIDRVSRESFFRLSSSIRAIDRRRRVSAETRGSLTTRRTNARIETTRQGLPSFPSHLAVRETVGSPGAKTLRKLIISITKCIPAASPPVSPSPPHTRRLSSPAKASSG